MHTILIADDDITLSEMLAEVCHQDGYTILVAHTTEKALEISRTEDIDLFLIDMVLPTSGGMALCEMFRSDPRTADKPIIFMTGQGGRSLVESLNAGADDYIQKPFIVRELLARVRAHLRRMAMETIANQKTIYLNSQTGQVFVEDREAMLTNIEFALLQFLCQQPQVWHTTKKLLRNVWNYPEDVGDAALVRNHIRNLRHKIEVDPKRPAIIHSHHGKGYVVQARVQFMTM
jgi:two-component system, OmpR family, response regulator RpaA